MRIDTIQDLDFEGRTIYYSIENEDGSYHETFSSMEELMKAVENFGDRTWIACSWSVLRGDTIFVNDIFKGKV